MAHPTLFMVDFTQITTSTPFYVYVVTLNNNGTPSNRDDDYVTIGALAYDPSTDPDGNGTNNEIIANSNSDGFKDDDLRDALGLANSPNLQLNYVADDHSGFAVSGSGADYYYSNVPLSPGTVIQLDGNTQWDPNAVCFLSGTKLATPDGEVAVEDLRIGELVLTHSGGAMPVRWIGRSTYNVPFGTRNREVAPIQIRAGALGENLPSQDLYVSPRHCMLVDGALIPTERLVNGASIVQTLPSETIEYFHIELDTHDCVRAAGSWSESFLDNGSRFRFHNASEHDGVVRGSAVPFAAPMVEDGPELVNRLLPILDRAGLLAKPGPLVGVIDVCDTTQIIGWAFDAKNPETPVIVDVLLDGTLITTTAASDYRKDVQQAGFGLGHAGFAITLTQGQVQESDLPRLEVRRRTDGAPLREMAAQRLSA